MAFEYTPYRNPYIGTIADLMARGEDAKAKALIDVASAQARAAEAKGQIYGNAISSIGQDISKSLRDYNSPAAKQQREMDQAQAILKARGLETRQGERVRVNPGNLQPGRPFDVFTDAPVEGLANKAFSGIDFRGNLNPSVRTDATFRMVDGEPIEVPAESFNGLPSAISRSNVFGGQPDTTPSDGLSRSMAGVLGQTETRTSLPTGRKASLESYKTAPVGRYTTEQGMYDVKTAYNDLIQAGISPTVAGALAGQGQQANAIFAAFDKQKEDLAKTEVAMRGSIASMVLNTYKANPNMPLENILPSVMGPAGNRIPAQDLEDFQVAMFGKSPQEQIQMLQSLVKQWDDQSPLRVLGRGDVAQGISGTTRGEGQSFPEPKITPGDVEVEGYKKYVAEGGELSIGAYRAQEAAKASSAGNIERFVTNALATATEKNNGVRLTPAQENAVTVAAKRQFALSNADPNVAADIALRREQIIEEGKRGLATPEGKWGSLASDLTYGLDSVDTKSFTNRFNKIGKDDKPGDAAALARSENNRRTMIRAAAMKSMGEAKSKQITSREMAASQLRELRSALAELPGTNMITGLTEQGLQKLGTSGDQKYVAAMSRANSALNAYTNAISGAQFGEEEALRYRQLFPKLTNTVANNLTLIDTMISLSKADEFSQWNSLAGNNPDGVNWLLNRSSARF